MNPNNDRQGGDVPQAVGQQPVTQPEPASSSSSTPVQQAATANVIRSQIDALYGGSPVAEQKQQPVIQPVAAQTADQQYAAQSQAQPQAANPYDRTHSANPQPQAEQWKQYHSAWQNYYQQYYEGYYAQQKAVEEQQRQQATPVQNQPTTEHGFFSVQLEEKSEEGELTKDQALFDLRQKLLGQVRSRATKIRKSRHFIPIAASLAVVMVFAFLQYNQVLFAAVNAYVSPGAIDPQNIVIDPGGGVVGSESRLIIPKINVDVPAIYDVGADYDSQMAAMQKGVAHFPIPGANSHPGEIGNTVLSGHSSNDLFDPGDYKFIFAQLEKLATGDTIYANYNGKRYTYVVTKTEVVKPTEVGKLVYPTNKPVMTLITCTPLGTSQNRLLVTAEQISPDPAGAAAAPTGSGESGSDNATIPGASSPTILERIFGAR